MEAKPIVNAMTVALSGGVGGAKLALGLATVLPTEKLAIIANTGDDFEHLGLHIAPDIDTLLYTLSGLNNPETGSRGPGPGSLFTSRKRTMYFTDRGIEELESRRGDEEVTLGWLASKLRTFVDTNPSYEEAIERFATFLARDDSSDIDD